MFIQLEKVPKNIILIGGPFSNRDFVIKELFSRGFIINNLKTKFFSDKSKFLLFNDFSSKIS